MVVTGFKLKSSLVRDLKLLVLISTVFFLLGWLATILSNRNILRGLEDISSSNGLLETCTRASAALDSSSDLLKKAISKRSWESTQTAFRTSLFESFSTLRKAAPEFKQRNDTSPLIDQAESALTNYGNAAERIMTKISNGRGPSDQSGDMLEVRQFELEASDSLRKLELALKTDSDHSFAEAYRFRHVPLLINSFLAILFFCIVLFLGVRTSSRFERSIQNLVSATEAISVDGLDYRPKVLHQDEIGFLTASFNEMVDTLEKERKSLIESNDRLARLQFITASFSSALGPDEIIHQVVRQASDAVGALGGVVALVTEDRSALEFCSVDVYPEEIASEIRRRFTKVSLSSGLPIAEALKRNEPVIIESTEDIAALGIHSLISVPLSVEDMPIGVISLGFSKQRKISADERDFLMALGRQCSQALRRTQLFEGAQKAIRLRDEFLSIASHELRTPLTSLKLQTQSLSRQLRAKDPRPEVTPEITPKITNEKLLNYTHLADRQLKRLSALIDGLMDVSRISSGRFTLNLEELDLGALLEEASASFSGQLATARSRLVVDIEKGVKGRFDRLRTEQVLLNLLGNAVKFAPEHPIELSMKTQGNRALISVRDYGPGIPLEHQERIFGRFERVEGRDNVGGLGLGLYISKQIVEAHGGRIWVESTSGNGATFRIELPIVADRPDKYKDKAAGIG